MMPDRQTGNAIGQQYDDEIDLRDLLRTLIRRKWLILLITILSAGFASGYWASRTPIYTYTTFIAIGSKMDVDGDISPLESISIVIDKIRGEMIPLLVERQQSRNPDTQIEINIENFGEIQTIIFKSQGSLELETDHFALHRELAEMVINEYKQFDTIKRRETRLRLDAKARNIQLLLFEKERLAFQLTVLDTEKQQITDQLAALEQQLSAVRPYTVTSIDSANREEGSALTRMTLVNEMLAYQQMQADLLKRLTLGIPERHQSLEESLKRNKIAIQEAENEQQILDLRGEILSSLPSTRIIAGPSVSPSPVGRGRQIYLALGLVAGLMLGIFSAFFAEMLSGLNQKQETGA